MPSITPATYEEFLAMAGRGTVVPLVKTVMADLLTPVSAYLRIERRSPQAFLFESIEGGEKIARYSFLGCAPHTIVRARNIAGDYCDQAEITVERAGGASEKFVAPMLDVMRDLMREHKPVNAPGLPPFTGGAVGYFGYDAVRWFERLPRQAKDDLDMDTAVVMFFSSLLAFDHVKHQIQIIANVFTGGEKDGERLREKYIAACGEIARLEASLAAPIEPLRRRDARSLLQVNSNMSKEYYLSSVERIKEYIRAGDAFQVVFAQRFETEIKSSPFQIYRALRVVNPLAVHIFSQAGRRRDATRRFARDVGAVRRAAVGVPPDRGDLQARRGRGRGRSPGAIWFRTRRSAPSTSCWSIWGATTWVEVAEYGSVEVADLMFVERFSHVMHLTSSLKATLREGLDCFDALAATFPAGTLLRRAESARDGNH